MLRVVQAEAPHDEVAARWYVAFEQQSAQSLVQAFRLEALGQNQASMALKLNPGTRHILLRETLVRATHRPQLGKIARLHLSYPKTGCPGGGSAEHSSKAGRAVAALSVAPFSPGRRVAEMPEFGRPDQLCASTAIT